MISLNKSYSVQLKRKPTSHTKLPRITPMAPISQKNAIINQFVQKPKHNLPPLGQTPLRSLYDKRGSSMVANKIAKSLTQQDQQSQTYKHKNMSTIKLQPVPRQDSKLSDRTVMPSSKLKITEEATRVSSQKPQSAGSSRASLHPVVNQIQHLISEEAKNYILPVKSYKQSAIGSVSSLWWAVVDSLFYSLQKILKVKQIQPANENKQSKTEQKQKSKTQKQSPNKTVREKKESPEKPCKKIFGVVESNTKASIEISRVYACLEQQNRTNEMSILRYYEDPNHVALVLEAFFFEKVVIYLLASLRKWCHHEELLLIHSLAIQNIVCIVECRRLLMDILVEGVENEQQDNKIRKPKYIAREKKLIQISKFTGMMKNEYKKYINGLGSPNRYRTFYFPDNLRDHAALLALETQWRNLTLDVPIPPFIQSKPNRKEFLVVIQPLNLLYKYNKKQESLQIDPYAQLFLKRLVNHFDIVFFTAAEKESSLLNFLGILENSQILCVLDKHHLTYMTAKPIKDISKIGGGYPEDKVLVIDEKANAKYYPSCKHAVLLVDGNHNETKIARVNGKLVRMDDHDEDYLNNLSTKIINCALKGAHWSEILHEKSEKKK